MKKKDLNYFRAIPYSRRLELIVESDGTHYWIASIEELPGCRTDGKTCAEAILNLDDAFDLYIEAKLEWDSPIPKPTRPKVKVQNVPCEKSLVPKLEEPIGCSISPQGEYVATEKKLVPAEITTTADSYSYK